MKAPGHTGGGHRLQQSGTPPAPRRLEEDSRAPWALQTHVRPAGKGHPPLPGVKGNLASTPSASNKAAPPHPASPPPSPKRGQRKPDKTEKS